MHTWEMPGMRHDIGNIKSYQMLGIAIGDKIGKEHSCNHLMSVILLESYL